MICRTRSVVPAVAASLLGAAAQAQEVRLLEIDGYLRSMEIDFVFDSSRDTLFVSTEAGTVDRFHLPSAKFLSRWEVGSITPAIDLSADGQILLLTEARTYPGSKPGFREGRVHGIDPDTGETNEFNWEIEHRDGAGSWDIVAMEDGRAFFTPVRGEGSELARLRVIDLGTGEVSERKDVPISVELDGRMFRSPSRNRFFLQGSPEQAIFDAELDEFIATGRGFVWASFNADGSLLASNLRAASPPTNDLRILNERFHAIALIPEGGLFAHAFDPVRERFYYVDRPAYDLVVVSSSTWTEIGRLASPYPLSNHMEVSPDGLHAFVDADEGIVHFRLPDVFPACSANCDGDFSLDIFDFVCFQDAFVAMEPYADCDGSGVFDVFDFICFQDAFVAGCP